MTIHEILQHYWKHQTFRPMQEDIIQSVLSGNDTLALLPTGGGKSVCFQVPALTKEGICIVVSPLIALMKDQVENLQAKGIEAISIVSGMGRREVDMGQLGLRNHQISVFITRKAAVRIGAGTHPSHERQSFCG